MAADATVEADTVGLFETAAAQRRIDCAIYNTGNNTPGRIEEMSVDYFEQSCRSCWFRRILVRA